MNHLPSELLLHICKFINDQFVVNIRLLSKYHNSTMAHYIPHNHYSIKCLDITNNIDKYVMYIDDFEIISNDDMTFIIYNNPKLPILAYKIRILTTIMFNNINDVLELCCCLEELYIDNYEHYNPYDNNPCEYIMMRYQDIDVPITFLPKTLKTLKVGDILYMDRGEYTVGYNIQITKTAFNNCNLLENLSIYNLHKGMNILTDNKLILPSLKDLRIDHIEIEPFDICCENLKNLTIDDGFDFSYIPSSIEKLWIKSAIGDNTNIIMKCSHLKELYISSYTIYLPPLLEKLHISHNYDISNILKQAPLLKELESYSNTMEELTYLPKTLEKLTISQPHDISSVLMNCPLLKEFRSYSGELKDITYLPSSLEILTISHSQDISNVLINCPLLKEFASWSPSMADITYLPKTLELLNIYHSQDMSNVLMNCPLLKEFKNYSSELEDITYLPPLLEELTIDQSQDMSNILENCLLLKKLVII